MTPLNSMRPLKSSGEMMRPWPLFCASEEDFGMERHSAPFSTVPGLPSMKGLVSMGGTLSMRAKMRFAAEPAAAASPANAAA